MNIIRQYKGLPKQIYILCGVRIVTSMGAFVFSMSSLLLTSILSMTEVATGYFMVILSLSGVLGAFLCGRLADQLGRKRTMLGVFVVEIIALGVGGAVVYSKWVMLCLIVVDFCFSGFIPILAALITDKTDTSNRSESFSLLVFCINIGYGIGQVFAGLLFYDHTRWIMWGQGIAFLITFILMAILVKDDYVPLGRLSSDQMINGAGQAEVAPALTDAGLRLDTRRSSLVLLAKDGPLMTFLFAVVLMYFSYSQVNYMGALMLSKYFGVATSARWISHIWTLNSIFCVVLSPLMLPLIKNRSQFFNASLAAACYCVGFGMFALLTSRSMLWIALLCTPVWTCGEVLVTTGTTVFVGSRAPEGYKARFQSFYQLANGLGTSIGPMTMGYFLLRFNYQQGWILVAGLCMMAVIVLAAADRADSR